MSGRIISGERVLTAGELDRRAALTARGLAAAGVGAGDAVALLMRNDFPVFEATKAAGLVAASSVPINWHFGPDEVGHILTDSGSKVLVAHEDLLAHVRSGVPSRVTILSVATPPEIARAYGRSSPPPTSSEITKDWDAWLAEQSAEPLHLPHAGSSTIVYTSGTTGKPKGVLRKPASAQAARRAANAVADLYDFRPDARAAITGPMYHSALNAYGLGMADAGADVWLMPRFEAEGLLAMIERYGLTHLHLVPIMFVRLLKLPAEVRARYDVSSLRHVVHAAAPCPPDVKRRMIDWWGPIIHEYFGSTETRAIAACDTQEWLSHPGSVGRRLPDTDIEIVGDSGQVLPYGEVGEIYARNHAVEDFTYTGDAEKRMQVERNGLITSGDVGYMDSDGFLYLCDRRRDMINSGGVNIYPAEIEGCLLGLEGVQDIAVFGVPDGEYGEAVAAVVQLKPGAKMDAEVVRSFVRQKLARYKAPKVVTFADQLPRDDSGKIFKQRLREPYWQNAGRRI